MSKAHPSQYLPPRPEALDKIEHIVVVMLENRSFDNLLGWLYEGESPRNAVPPSPAGTLPTYDGLTEGEHWNRFSANETQVKKFNDLKASDCKDDTPQGDQHQVQHHHREDAHDGLPRERVGSLLHRLRHLVATGARSSIRCAT